MAKPGIAIQVERLSKVYPGGNRALTDFSLSVKVGEIFGFLGPNGAGKTTTIKILLGFMPPTAGTLRVLDADPQRPETRRRIGYLPEVANYYGYMTVDELLSFYGRLCGMTRAAVRDRTRELLEVVGLADVRRRQLKHFSKGMLQRAGIAQALLHDPDILILDEPMTGLDPPARLQMRDIILEQKKQGKTVFFSSHELSEAELICDRVGILKAGSIVWCGPTRQVTGDGARNLERIFLNMIQTDKPEVKE